MAKMFYSLEEAAQRLGKSVPEVQEMVDSGQLQEFRDRERIVLKRDQVELLAGDAGEDTGGVIPLADSRGGGSSLALSLEDSGPLTLEPDSPSAKSSPGRSSSGMGLAGSGSGIEIDEPTKERSGITIFDDGLEEGDPSAVTQITEGAGGGVPEFNLETVGSGSGLLDLTREGDDTSLGADLLEDVYKGDEDGGGGAPAETTGSSGLFESTSAASDMSVAAVGSAGMGGLMLAEPYDGKASGWTGGVALGAVIVAIVSIAAVVLGQVEAGSNPIVNLFAGNFMMWMGIAAGVVILCGVVGLLLGRRS